MDSKGFVADGVAELLKDVQLGYTGCHDVDGTA